MAPTCLLLTILPLYNLTNKKFGVYRRLSTLAIAAKRAGASLKIFCVIPHQMFDPEANAAIADDILREWGVDCEVIVGRSKLSPTLPWLLLQLLGTLKYKWTPFARNLLDAESIGRISEELNLAPDIIIVHKLPMMSVVSRMPNLRSPIFFDLDDIEHVVALRSLSVLSLRNKIVQLLSLPALLYSEFIAVSKAHVTFVCSELDARRIRKQFRTNKVMVLPNSIDIPVVDAPLATTPILLMVGIYSFEPNKEAADYFVREVFPLILRALPDAEVWFVGGAAECLEDYGKGTPGVKFLGFVDDIDEVYRRARVVICPIQRGSGTRVKLVEAAAWRKPIVTTTIGAEGLDMIDGVHALFGDNPHEFATRCIELLLNDQLCNRLGENAGELAAQKFDKGKIIKELALKFSSV